MGGWSTLHNHTLWGTASVAVPHPTLGQGDTDNSRGFLTGPMKLLLAKVGNTSRGSCRPPYELVRPRCCGDQGPQMSWKYLHNPLLGVSIMDLSSLKYPTPHTFKVKPAYLCVGRGAGWGLPVDMAGYLHRV